MRAGLARPQGGHPPRTRGHDEAEGRVHRGASGRKGRLALVFPSELGTPLDPSNLERAWKRVAAAIGPPALRFHDLRHAHATLMLVAGVHPKVVADRLGHSSIRITMDTYAHVFPALQVDAARHLDRLLHTGR